MSPKEVEETLPVSIDMRCEVKNYEMGNFPLDLSHIHELSTMCGFDPTLDGADICSYFNLSPLEIFDKAHTNLDNLAVIGELFYHLQLN